jgi:signal transduction histidine kinase/DNA-binding NarL/FixJ family response regulator
MKIKLNVYTKLIIVASFIISAGLVLFIAFNANSHLNNMSENNAELYNTYRISELMKSFKSNLLSLENKQKGFLITGDRKFLEEYRVRETQTKTYLIRMGKYFSGKPEEEIFYKLKNLTYRKLMEVKDLNQQYNLAGFSAKENGDDNKSSTMSDIHALIDEIESSLGKTSQTLIDNSVDYVRVSKKWSVLEVVLGVVVSFLALLLLIRDINIRNKLEDELRIAKKLADDNATLKEQFMANMSHEIRTPMNAILGFTDLIQKTKLDGTQTDYLKAIRISSSNLLNIINDILDFSKIEAGKLVIEKISFSLSALVDSLHVMFLEKAKEKKISFEVSVDEKIPAYLFGDPTRLSQILVNLINNAIKFTETGRVRLSCELKRIEHDVAELVFRVRDTGIGISPEKINHVFDRFNQGNKETTRKYGGTGLGLSIVKDLVELQNGEITVKSKVNAGSEFVVRISYPVSYETTGSLLESQYSSLPAISNNKITVLLAEDNELNQKLAMTYLSGFGLNVDVANNGLVALEKLKEKKYDLVLMDIQMPLLDGYSTAQKIRNELKLSLPVIAMTAHIMPGEKEKCLGFGMNDYISKPFKEVDLHSIVSKYLEEIIDPGTTVKGKVTQLTSSNGFKSTVDLRTLKEMSRGSNQFIREMIDLYLENTPGDLETIDQAIKTADYPTIRAISHRMKTSLGFMGLQHLLEPLSSMEDLSENNNDLEKIATLFQKVKGDCELAELEFREVLINL